MKAKWFTRCEVLTKNGCGEIHVHSIWRFARQVLYLSLQGDWYDMPNNGDGVMLRIMGNDNDAYIVAQLLGREITH